jgi:hypothetical protein
VKFKAEIKANREAASFDFIWGLGISQIIKKIIQSNSKKFSLHGYVKKKENKNLAGISALISALNFTEPNSNFLKTLEIIVFL